MNDAPRQSPDFETGCISHTGKVRKANEDNFILRPEIGLWAVADGMGGHENGALASATVVAALETVGAAGSAPDLLAMLEAGVLKANDDLRAEIGRRGATMGATLVCLLIHQRHFACLWSGDSRIYLIRGGIIAQVSRDHTEVRTWSIAGFLPPRRPGARRAGTSSPTRSACTRPQSSIWRTARSPMATPSCSARTG